MTPDSLLAKKPLVAVAADGAFEFYLDGEMVYDCEPRDAGDALRWVEHMALKTWVTPKHLQQFARLAADKFGAGYR